MSDEMLEAALRYARAGYPVLPVNSHKAPLTPKGYKDATTDEQQIRKLWMQYPHTGIGIVAGEKSGIIVIDLDIHPASGNGSAIDGIKVFDNYLQSIGHSLDELHQGVWARTGGGGEHILFRIPENLTIRNRPKVMPGVDILSTGRHFVVEPTPHYYWEIGPLETEVQVLYDYLFDLVLGKVKRETSLEEQQIFKLGERHTRLVQSAGHMRASGMDSDGIGEQLRIINQTRCDPPLSDEEIRAIAQSMGNYPAYPTNNGSHALTQPEWTDRGNAQRLAQLKANSIKFNYSDKLWLSWNSNYWVVDRRGEIYNHIADLSSQLRSLASIPGTPPGLVQSMQKTAARVDNRAGRDALETFAQTLPEFATDNSTWDASPWFLGLKNGVYDLKAREFRAGKPEDYITRVCNTSYDASARCPLWLAFLESIFSDQLETIPFLQSAVGYSLTGDIRERALFVLIGRGSNGKSVFIRTISNLLGRYAMPAQAHTFERASERSTQTDDLANLVGLRFITLSELPEGTRLNEARIKAFTGGETMTARHLYGRPFEFTPSGKLWLSSNYAPRISDYTDGIWNRLKRFDFNQQFTGDREDRQLSEKLREELPGILNWAIEGCNQWQEKGLQPPAKVIEAGRNYRASSDSVNEFLTESCTFSESSFCFLQPLWLAFQLWENRRGIGRSGAMSYQRFRDRLDTKFKWESDVTDRRYLGFELQSSATPNSVQIRLN